MNLSLCLDRPVLPDYVILSLHQVAILENILLYALMREEQILVIRLGDDLSRYIRTKRLANV